MLVEVNKEKDIQDDLLYSVKTLSYTEVMITLYHLEGVSVRQNTAKKRFYGDYKQTNQNPDLKKFVESTIIEKALTICHKGQVYSLKKSIYLWCTLERYGH